MKKVASSPDLTPEEEYWIRVYRAAICGQRWCAAALIMIAIIVYIMVNFGHR